MSRIEILLNALLTGSTDVPEPQSRVEELLYALIKKGGTGNTSAGGGTMIVNISNLEYDEGNAYYVGIADSPVAEIKAAWDDGQIIFANVTYPDLGVPTRLLCVAVVDTGDSETGTAAMFSTVIHAGNGATVIGATIAGYGEYQMAMVAADSILATSIE